MVTMPVYTIFFVLFIALISIQRLHETFFSGKRKDGITGKKETLTLKILAVIHATVIIGTTLEFFYVKRELNFLITLIGIGMYLMALIVRRISIKTLGSYHSYNIEIFNEHQLIRRGIYKYMRHPIYAVTILELLGIPLVGNAYYLFCVSLILYMPVLGIRLLMEEKELIKKFGEEYIQYKRQVPALLPAIILRRATKIK